MVMSMPVRLVALGDQRFSIPDRSGHFSLGGWWLSKGSRAVFTVEERGRLQEQLPVRAEADGAIAGAAFTGSHAIGESDRWSGTDLVLAVRGQLSPLGTTLARELTRPELRRALAAAINVVTGELWQADPALAARLQPMLAELSPGDPPGA
jgi:hypothetical protein